MGLLAWHYSKGIEKYVKSFDNLILGIIHNFSFTTLIKTLFSPWKRLTVVSKSSGFNIQEFFENLTFNLISRGVGFVVRVILLFTGVLVLFGSCLFGIFFFLLFAVFPPASIPFYISYKKSPKLQLKKIVSKLISVSRADPKIIFNSKPGKFLLDHLGISFEEMSKNTDSNIKISFPEKITRLSQIIKICAEVNVWSESFLRSHSLVKEDLLFVANWWDQIQEEKVKKSKEGLFVGPGVGLSIIYGYTPTLNQYSSDLTRPVDFSHHLIGREKVVSRIERSLSSGRSVFLLGKPGVGKKTVILEFAHRARNGKLGKKLVYRRILELDYNALLSGKEDVNEKKNTLKNALLEGSSAGNILLIIRDIHRLTDKDVEGFDFTDILEEMFEKSDIKIIAFGNTVDYERFLSKNSRLRNHFDVVKVTEPTREEAMQIISQAVSDWEVRKKIIVTVQAVKNILEGSDKYITDTPFPEKALELLDAVVELAGKDGKKVVGEDLVKIILSEKTGIPFSNISKKEKGLLTNLEAVIHKTLVNQETAVNLIAKSLRSKVVKVSQKERPIGSFLFLGPTGVGKTETAKVLSNVYFGGEEAIIRFDMAQYSSEGSVEKLIGSKSSSQPGSLTTAVKNKPASLLLLDEIEKSERKAQNLFLTILDEGYLTDYAGDKVNFKHAFIIGTSNAAASYVWDLVEKGVGGQELQKKVVDHVLSENIFSPEFLNRFDGVVVFEPLSPDNLLKVAKLMANKLSKSLKKRGIELVVTDALVKKLASDGYDPAFGARPMRRIIDLVLGDIIGNAILKDEIEDGSKIELVPGDNKDEYTLTKLDV